MWTVTNTATGLQTLGLVKTEKNVMILWNHGLICPFPRTCKTIYQNIPSLYTINYVSMSEVLESLNTYLINFVCEGQNLNSCHELGWRCLKNEYT